MRYSPRRMKDRLNKLRSRKRERVTGAIEAVLGDCREILAAIGALDGLRLGPDDAEVVAAAETAATGGVRAAYAAAVVALAELATGEVLDESQRQAITDAANAAELTECGCFACGPPQAAAETLCEHYQHAMAGYVRGLADAGVDPYQYVSDDPEWRTEMRFLITDRAAIAEHLQAVLRINDRLAHSPRRR